MIILGGLLVLHLFFCIAQLRAIQKKRCRKLREQQDRRSRGLAGKQLAYSAQEIALMDARIELEEYLRV